MTRRRYTLPESDQVLARKIHLAVKGYPYDQVGFVLTCALRVALEKLGPEYRAIAIRMLTEPPGPDELDA